MSLGQSRRFGSGITNLYCEKDDAMEAYDYKKMKQKGMKVSLMAVDQYRDSIGESIRRKEQRKGELSKSSSKIGSVPAAYMDTKRNKWVPWDASEFQMQREREEIWQRLKHKTSIGSKTLSSLHITDGRDTEHLNPITHLPDAPSVDLTACDNLSTPVIILLLASLPKDRSFTNSLGLLYSIRLNCIDYYLNVLTTLGPFINSIFLL